MKAITCILILFSLGCRTQTEGVIEPNLLLGTWKASFATAQLPNRWTFDSTDLYMSTDTLSNCKRSEGQRWQYRTEKNLLIARYLGPTNGLFPIKDTHFSITLLTSERLIISTTDKIQEFERCK